ncbi:MAG TPA: ATP-binding protein, partial [Dehalococcoidia bacterium]|nr:ATP-binding protein [Dehalococcoidia bacterium]
MWNARTEPAAEIRGFKGRVYLLVISVIVAITPGYSLVLGLSALGALALFIMTILVMVVTVESVFLYNFRMRTRITYPHHLGFTLATIRDFSQSCRTAVELAGRWLRADAAVLAWLSDDGDYLLPLACYGLPEEWLDTAPRISMGSRSLRQALQHGAIFKPSTQGDPWFSTFSEKDHVVYVPLVNHDTPLGVLALTGRKRRWELHDERLLSSIGMVMAIALDNSRLSEGEREQARRMQKLAQMKSSFLTIVSHELRTPLTSIRTAAEMLLEEEERESMDGAKTRLVRNIVKGAARLGNLVADLTEAAKNDELSPRLELETVPAGEIAANAVALVYPLLTSKEQKIDVSFNSTGPLVLVDRTRFEQVLVNLLSNANRFTPVGGRIDLAIREQDGEVLITIADSGPGIAPEERELIFEPFYRGDRSGMGMGLAIAKAIVEMHQGRIWVEPQNG